MSGPSKFKSSKTTVESSQPCGNPKRYVGRDVVRMSRSQGLQHGASRHRRSTAAADNDDSSKTEAELHMQRLLQKQLKTDVTIASHFSEHRTFSEATTHCPGVEKLVGVHQHDRYKQAKDLDHKVDLLRHYGLDDEEITLKLQQEMGEVPSSGFGLDPEIRKNKLIEIDKKIEEKERQLSLPHATKGALLLTRQEMEIELSHRQRYDREDGGQTKAASVAVLLQGTQAEPVSSHPDDPINHIPGMLDKVTGRVEIQERESRRDRRRKRKIEKKMQYYQQFENKDSNIEHSAEMNMNGCDIDHNVGSKSEESGKKLFGADKDTTKVCEDRLSSGGSEEEMEATCAPRPLDWVSVKTAKKRKKTQPPSADPVELDPDIDSPLSVQEMEANRLCIEEIKQLPKFQNYVEGDPSKVLYLKNLASKTTVADLMRLFACFHDDHLPKISFRLLTGRMQGQAFVTTPDLKTSTAALGLINGYMLHGSPIIASYGRKS